MYSHKRIIDIIGDIGDSVSPETCLRPCHPTTLDNMSDPILPYITILLDVIK